MLLQATSESIKWDVQLHTAGCSVSLQYPASSGLGDLGPSELRIACTEVSACIQVRRAALWPRSLQAESAAPMIVPDVRPHTRV